MGKKRKAQIFLTACLITIGIYLVITTLYEAFGTTWPLPAPFKNWVILLDINSYTTIQTATFYILSVTIYLVIPFFYARQVYNKRYRYISLGDLVPLFLIFIIQNIYILGPNSYTAYFLHRNVINRIYPIYGILMVVVTLLYKWQLICRRDSYIIQIIIGGIALISAIIIRETLHEYLLIPILIAVIAIKLKKTGRENQDERELWNVVITVILMNAAYLSVIILIPIYRESQFLIIAHIILLILFFTTILQIKSKTKKPSKVISCIDLKMGQPLTQETSQNKPYESIAGSIINIIDRMGENLKDSGFSIGIFGRWGTGKTSILNTIKYLIENTERNIDVDYYDILYYSGYRELLAGFFTIINDLLSKNHPDYPVIARAIKRIQSKILIQPTVHLGIMDLGLQRKQFGEGAYEDKTISEAIRTITTGLQKENRKYVILIDNMDRLAAQDMLQILKICRIFTDIPNMVFVIAADREILRDLLKQEGMPFRFLEKIIKANIILPTNVHTDHEKVFKDFLELFRKFICKKIGEGDSLQNKDDSGECGDCGKREECIVFKTFSQKDQPSDNWEYSFNAFINTILIKNIMSTYRDWDILYNEVNIFFMMINVSSGKSNLKVITIYPKNKSQEDGIQVYFWDLLIFITLRAFFGGIYDEIPNYVEALNRTESLKRQLIVEQLQELYSKIENQNEDRSIYCHWLIKELFPAYKTFLDAINKHTDPLTIKLPENNFRLKENYEGITKMISGVEQLDHNYQRQQESIKKE
jgi:hypothetical protein